MTLHQLLFIGVEPRRLHQDSILDSDLSDVVKQSRELYLLNLPFRKGHVSCDGASDPRHPIRVTAGEAVLGIDCLAERGHCSEKELASLRVLGKGIPGKVQRD